MTEPETVAGTRPVGACSVCPHMWAEHDALGVRFCTATMETAKDRGCICRSSAAPV
ncbi:RGCVC family protein [Actinomycetospora atypica]|uniref:RGCVC family protein n=1 Tax=Actinomycetospora atypica TaxID=1290095 RepID=A0ABV9YLQ4_9PSEU